MLLFVSACNSSLPGTPLALTTAASGDGGCATAALLPVKIEQGGGGLTFVSAGTGKPVSIVWPFGFAARLVDGVAELIGSNGSVIGRQGDLLNNLGGGLDASGTAFHVCSVGATTY